MSLVRIEKIKFHNVAGFLLFTDTSAVLIDTGHASTVGKFSDAMERSGMSPQDIDLIVLTHTHFDHAGGAQQIKKISGAKLAVQKNEADYLRQGCTPYPKGTRWKAKVLVTLGRLFAPGKVKYPKIEADILIDKELDLKAFGIQGKVLHTPGHTNGSVSVLLENGAAFVGDNVLGISLKQHYPPFANNRELVLESWERYIKEGVKTLYPAHGNCVPIEYLISEIEEARIKYL
jgi:glyoxylase-like metal-dependent hydrolase (beta-lactamase superfamily II)